LFRLSASQQEIVRLLRRQGDLTVEELSRQIGITSVAVRQHLETLEAEGFLAIRTERRPIGRPRRLYRLTDLADDLFPKSYSLLAETILEHLEGAGGPGMVAEVFDSRRRKTESEIAPRLIGQSLEQRVRTVTQIQDQSGYMAEYEGLPDQTFVIREHNCAICKVARRFPQACQKELEMFQNLLDADVERVEHMAAGDPQCAYIVRPKSTAARELGPKRDPSLSRPELAVGMIILPSA
jgi:predicted ArsR family transcriptional regulator